MVYTSMANGFLHLVRLFVCGCREDSIEPFEGSSQVQGSVAHLEGESIDL